jgi:3-(3-hydroxy-phenyl)propionate hydroxylase
MVRCDELEEWRTMDTSTGAEHAVVIVGGGPTGMMLAAELTLAGIDALIVERRATQELDSPRSRGLHSRTIEVLDQRGVAERFLAEGTPYPGVGFAYIRLDISDFPTRHNYLLGLAQPDFERIMAGWIEELGVPTIRLLEVVGFTQDHTGVDVALSDGSTLRARYLVGCDGGRSVVRKTAGIDFPGFDPSASFVTAEVEMTDDPPLGIRPEGGGIGPVNPGGKGLYGVVVREQQTDHLDGATMQDLRDALVATYGTDFGAHSPRWITRFTDMTRQADSYRRGRVLLAGDAAHIHAPLGGQGLNVGVQDAVNLGWKLAQVVKGISAESLLDTYHDERHPVGARVQQDTMAQTALANADDRHRALHATMTELLAMDEPRRHIAGMMAGLDVHYDFDEGHPLLGRRMPDLDLRTADGPTRVFALLHEARAVLLDLSGSDRFDEAPWAGRVRFVHASYDGVWELPIIGQIAGPAAVLIRPDGHVAWVGDLADPELSRALERWFGAPTPSRTGM